MANAKDMSVQYVQEDNTQDNGAPEDFTGTVRFTDKDKVFLIPTPSADPRGTYSSHDFYPLNLPKWRKVLFVIIVSLFSCAAGSMVSGFGSLLAFYRPKYIKAGADVATISGLVAYPTIFQGLGNLVFIPVANAIGRRPVFLLVCLIAILGGVIASRSTTLEVHLAGRMVLGLGAGLGEALPPMMVSEIHFLHERSTALMWQSGIQAIGAAVFVLCASPIAYAIQPENWYMVLIAVLSLVFLSAVFFLPESKYHRHLATEHDDTNPVNNISSKQAPALLTLEDRPTFDLINYKPRTLHSDVNLFVNAPEWKGIPETLIRMTKVFFFPTVLWAFVLNGTALGAMISISATQATVLLAPPYSWSSSSISYVNAGQIVVGIIAIPLLGYGSDFMIKWRARRNGGIHEPESRLIPLVIPLSMGIIALLVYGAAAQYSGKIHWGALIFAVPADFFSFVGINIATITYLLDSFPTAENGPILILITAVRGFVGFGFSYSVTQFVSTAGYLGCFGTYAGLNLFLGVLGVIIFLTGKSLRDFQARFL
ncbi:uncharacterized protein JN550_005531 [Neoarthrinium moseri]|uniref:uncharacterized protein n=1 Tax=Neoarthrinium moseri TaxID=1658444 RepID=UPI001FDE186B|nr:uncharacterized protein JN550_005531 [Neoarthrinium moseri]KAI1869941.1 hypothetical protein JN550_005531 [Neoarthrinium moseri]